MAGSWELWLKSMVSVCLWPVVALPPVRNTFKTAAATHLFLYASGYFEDDIIGPVFEESMVAHLGTINHIFGSEPVNSLPTDCVCVLYTSN